MIKNVRREGWESLKPTICGWGTVDTNHNVTRYEKIGGKNKITW